MAASDAAVERAAPVCRAAPHAPRANDAALGHAPSRHVLPAVLLVTALSSCTREHGPLRELKDTAPAAGRAHPGELAHRAGRCRHVPVLANSILIALPRTILALALATAFAWCVARTNTPCPRLLEGLSVLFSCRVPWVLA